MALRRSLTGESLSHYTILEEIGSGGMGVVYRARDQRLERDVALKVLPAETLENELARRRFRKEALALSRLNHPNIATVHDFDTDRGVDFLVMELVAGPTLDELARGGPLKENDVIRFASDLLAGLSAAHSEGIVHRDLKPGNVRLTPDGRLKILDFGLARLVHPEGTAPGATTVSVETVEGAVGTLPYMAPEQLRGEPIDLRVDLWAAGALLYELTTGRRAFTETGHAPLILSILHRNPPPPRRINPDLRPGLENIILHCLQKDPGSRYQSADEISRDLQRLETGQEVAAPRRRWRPATLVAGALVALVAVAGSLALLSRGARNLVFGAPIRSLAVLPLVDLSGGTEGEYFVDGMTEELIAAVAQIGALKVISRTSVMAFKNTHQTLPQIARALHVDSVLEGSVSRAGDRIRIEAELIRASTDEHIWSRTYERDFRDVLAIQNDVARSIAEQIKIAVTPKERARLAQSRAIDPDAHSAYLRGLYNWNLRTTASIEKAIEYFRQSAALDPSYAPPYSGLAACYAVLPAYDPAQATEALRDSRTAALRALQLDSTLAEPHAVLAGVMSEYDYNQRGSELELRRAIELNPSYATAHQWYADDLASVGREKEAMEQIQLARQLDPLSLIINTEVGGVLARARKWDQAIEALRNTIAMDPSFPRSHETLGFAYGCAGKIIESTYEYQTEDSLLGTRTGAEAARWYEPLRRAFRESGERGYYRQLLRQRLELARKGGKVQAIKIAVPYARLGENDSAFVWLGRACDEHDPLVLRLKVEPHWDGLRGDPRYVALLRRLGLPADS